MNPDFWKLSLIAIMIGFAIFASFNLLGMGIYMKNNQKLPRAIAVIFPSGKRKINGYITLSENKTLGITTIQASLKGLPPNKKLALHVHQFGDLRDMKTCLSTGSHYNPDNVDHAGPHDKIRHIGDFGNLKSNSNGDSKSKIRIKCLLLTGKKSVLGRALVIHAGEDDLGKGGTEESLKTGSAGKRIGCGVIGYMK